MVEACTEPLRSGDLYFRPQIRGKKYEGELDFASFKFNNLRISYMNCAII